MIRVCQAMVRVFHAMVRVFHAMVRVSRTIDENRYYGSWDTNHGLNLLLHADLFSKTKTIP